MFSSRRTRSRPLFPIRLPQRMQSQRRSRQKPAPNMKSIAPATNAALVTAAPPPAPPKEEPPPNKEEIQGNQYTNFTHGFRMYKAPSWELIEDARKALPNAIVAMGTSNESTLMV